MSASAEVVQLRELLQAPDQSEFERLQARVAELERLVERHLHDREARTSYVSGVLAEAVEHRASRGPRLNEALRPQVNESVYRLTREDPETIAEALYPVLGRAVRMIVASMFTRDAARGKTFRVEQLFLIERVSGRPMIHLAAQPANGSDGLVLAGGSTADRGDGWIDGLAPATVGDGDVVSGMMEALRSFVQDSFHTTDHDGMRELAVGDVTVMVEWGPQAVLAAVTRGVAPESVRFEMQKVLEMIHLDFGAELEGYDGDPATLHGARPLLVGLADSSATGVAATQRSYYAVGVMVMMAALVVGLVLAAGLSL